MGNIASDFVITKWKWKWSEVAQSCLILCNPIDFSLPGSSVHGIFQAGKGTGVGCYFLLQGIFPSQESNPSFPYCRQTLYPLSHKGSPTKWKVTFKNCIKKLYQGFPDSSVGKESACNAGDPSSIPGSGKSPGEGIGYPLQYSVLENSMDCIVYGVAKSLT